MNLEIMAHEAKISLTPESSLSEIVQNVKIILLTYRGSVPLFRKFGIDGSCLDLSSVVVRSKLIIDIIESIQDFEPRASVVSVSFDNNTEKAEEGILMPKVEVKIADEYIT